MLELRFSHKVPLLDFGRSKLYFWISFYIGRDSYEHPEKKIDENPEWILISLRRLLRVPRRFLMRFMEDFWWNLWKVFDENPGQFLMKIVVKFWWKSCKYYNESLGKISFENLRISDEFSAMFLLRILESLEKNREKIKFESRKNYDENTGSKFC